MPGHPRAWREALTDDEAAALVPLERRIAELKDELLILGARQHRIQNRASVRAGKASIPPVRLTEENIERYNAALTKPATPPHQEEKT